LVNERELFVQDIADWQPRNTVWIALGPATEERRIRVRLHALRDCPDWNWGPASTMTIERGRRAEWDGREPLMWGASSPYARASRELALSTAQALDRVSAKLTDAAGSVPALDAESRAAFEAARVVSGSLLDPALQVEHNRLTTEEGDLFGLVARAPRRGDYVEWSWTVSRQRGAGARVELVIKPKYGEKPSVAGHLAYSLLVGTTELFTQDVTSWHPRNTVWVAIGEDVDDPTVTVRLYALKDCPDWNWGASSPLTIERARTLEWKEGRGVMWGASSPKAVAGGASPVVGTGSRSKRWRRRRD
jgi:hypothetical protein